jgi:hypothetical protein
MTIRPAYDQPRPLAYINKVIREYHRLPIELVRWADGYHTLTFDDGVAYEEHSIMVPYTSHLRLGEWVREAIGFHQRVREEIRAKYAAEAEDLRKLVAGGRAVLEERKGAQAVRTGERGERIAEAYAAYDRTRQTILAEQYDDDQAEQDYRAHALQQLHDWEQRLEEITK